MFFVVIYGLINGYENRFENSLLCLCKKNMLYIINIFFWFLIFVGVSVKVDKRFLSMIKNRDMYFI